MKTFLMHDPEQKWMSDDPNEEKVSILDMPPMCEVEFYYKTNGEKIELDMHEEFIIALVITLEEEPHIGAILKAKREVPDTKQEDVSFLDDDVYFVRGIVEKLKSPFPIQGTLLDVNVDGPYMAMMEEREEAYMYANIALGGDGQQG